jgi:hypothetical protein
LNRTISRGKQQDAQSNHQGISNVRRQMEERFDF